MATYGRRVRGVCICMESLSSGKEDASSTEAAIL